MKPPPGQLSLFELDARGEPLVRQVDTTRASPAIPPQPEAHTVDVPANHDESLSLARRNGDDPLALRAGYLAQLAVAPAPAARVPSGAEPRQARDAWLRRLQTSRRSKSTLTAYRVAIDDLLDWSCDHGRNVFEEATIVDHLAAYQRRAQPAPATYYRRFGRLRRFVHWLSRRSGLPDPFLELEPPPKPQQEADWLTEDEFAQLLAAAEQPRRRRKGLAERDRLVLLALVQTSLRRSELTALDWRDMDLASERPSLLVRQGKGAKPRRQPLAPQLAEELGSCATSGSRRLRIPSSAGSRANGCSRRSSRGSSVAPLRAPALRSASPPTPSGTPRLRGFDSRRAMLGSSPPTSATPTFQLSAATRTSLRTSSMTPRRCWRSVSRACRGERRREPWRYVVRDAVVVSRFAGPRGGRRPAWRRRH